VPFINYVSSLATPLFLSLRLSANYESVNSLTSTGAEGSSKIVGKTPKIKETCIFGSEENNSRSIRDFAQNFVRSRKQKLGIKYFYRGYKI
jgi:hypothetical protein